MVYIDITKPCIKQTNKQTRLKKSIADVIAAIFAHLGDPRRKLRAAILLEKCEAQELFLLPNVQRRCHMHRFTVGNLASKEKT
jgi:hypothetical protein